MSRSTAMMIQSLRHHWPARKMEWVLAGLIFSWGLYVFLHPGMFTGQGSRQMFSGFLAFTPLGLAPYVFWGSVAMGVGATRLCALYINGAWVRTPIIRVIMAAATAFVFTQVSISLWQSGIANTGLVVYPWLVVADIISGYTAAKDAIHAEIEKRIDERGSANGSSSIRGRAVA